MSMLSTSRRDFFKTGGLLIGFSLASTEVLPQLAAATPAPGRLDAWLRIGADETVHVFTGKVDIGMGVQTALTQVVAEELDVSPARVLLVMGDTATTPDQGGVGGSTSISAGARPLRNAAATARLLLLQLAAAKLGVPVEQLQVSNGIVSRKDNAARHVSYGSLAGVQELNDTLRVSGGGFAINVEGSGKPKNRPAIPSSASLCRASIWRRRSWGTRPIAPMCVCPACCTGV